MNVYNTIIYFQYLYSEPTTDDLVYNSIDSFLILKDYVELIGIVNMNNEQ